MIEVLHVKKSYFGRPAVDDLTLAVREGSVFGFLGQNGAGKTTAIKMIVGITAPDAGEVLIDKRSSANAAVRETIGFMPEAPYFYERLTGMEFLAFCGALFHGAKRTTADYERILDMVDMRAAKDWPIETYSKGMKQRLGFAQTLVNDPAYIFLDEPLDGLDPIGRKEIKNIIKKLKHEGRTIFFNSHILYDIEELCDEIGVIHRGKLIYGGPVRDFARGLPLEERFVAVVEKIPKQ